MKIRKLILLAIPMMALTSCGNEPQSNKRVLKFEYLKAGFGVEVYEALAKKFEEENPDVTVKCYPNKDILTDTKTKMDTERNLSDIYLIQNAHNNIRIWSSQGKIHSLNNLFEEEVEDGIKVKQALDDNALKWASYNNDYIMIPEYYSITGFVYNHSLFEEKGYEIPKTTKELDDLCKNIRTNSDIDPIVYCGTSADGYLYHYVEGLMTSYEGVDNLNKFYKYEDKEMFSVANSQGKIKALDSLNKIFVSSGYTYPRSQNTEYITAQLQLLKKETAMMVNGCWFENEMSRYIERQPDADMRMFAIPQLSDENNNVLRSPTFTTQDNKNVIDSSFNSTYFIPKKANNTADAEKFLKFLCRKDVCELFTSMSNAVRPVNYDISLTNPKYANMSNFGKSILKIANENHLYASCTTNPIAIRGEISLWPSGISWNYKIISDPKTYTGQYCVEQDYAYVLNNWDRWHNE